MQLYCQLFLMVNECVSYERSEALQCSNEAPLPLIEMQASQGVMKFVFKVYC